MAERWFGCPQCGRSAKTSRELTAQGCEGTHLELMPVAEIEPLVAGLRSVEDVGDRNAVLTARETLRDFQNAQNAS